jgi:hypothetical protein
MSDVRLYQGADKTYRLWCVGCTEMLWSYDFALERRHIIDVADLTVAHICGDNNG